MDCVFLKVGITVNFKFIHIWNNAFFVRVPRLFSHKLLMWLKWFFILFFFPQNNWETWCRKIRLFFTHFLCFPAESPASRIHSKMWLLMCKLTPQTFSQSITSRRLQMHSTRTAQAEQALCSSSTVVMAGGSLHRSTCIILCLDFAIYKADSLSADPYLEIRANALFMLSLSTDYKTFFLIEPYK